MGEYMQTVKWANTSTRSLLESMETGSLIQSREPTMQELIQTMSALVGFTREWQAASVRQN